MLKQTVTLICVAAGLMNPVVVDQLGRLIDKLSKHHDCTVTVSSPATTYLIATKQPEADVFVTRCNPCLLCSDKGI